MGAMLLAGAGNAAAFSDQDDARDAYQRGEIMSLEDIRRNVQRDFNGQIIRTKLRSENADYVYNFRLLSPDGNMMSIDVDAKTSRVIDVKGKR
ncbi:MAG: PepSY domain-containing protein [Sphingomonadales bacterium]